MLKNTFLAMILTKDTLFLQLLEEFIKIEIMIQKKKFSFQIIFYPKMFTLKNKKKQLLINTFQLITVCYFQIRFLFMLLDGFEGYFPIFMKLSDIEVYHNHIMLFKQYNSFMSVNKQLKSVGYDF